MSSGSVQRIRRGIDSRLLAKVILITIARALSPVEADVGVLGRGCGAMIHSLTFTREPVAPADRTESLTNNE